MNPLSTARQTRVRLALRSTIQLTIALALFSAALFSGSRGGFLGLIVCGLAACAFISFGLRNLRSFRHLSDYSRAQKVQRREVSALKQTGWIQARQRRLPASCRRAVVMFTPEGDLAFVVGLSGYWPAREALAEPQRVAATLERFGTPHIPVCLAAFVTCAEESFNYGVLAVSPARFHDALTEATESFRGRQDRKLGGPADRNIPRQPEQTHGQPEVHA